MKSLRYSLFVVVLLVASCGDDTSSEIYSDCARPNSRSLYDNSYVEWDSTYYLSYKLANDELITNTLPVPWASGNSQAIGIPDEWIDRNITHSDAKQRMYSHVNGWEMVYSNLLELGMRNKYFML